MFETFKVTLTPMIVMFLCIMIGYVLNKTKIVPENTATVLSKLENYVLVPALILCTFMEYCTVKSITEKMTSLIYSFGVLILALAIAIPLSKLFSPDDDYKRNVYKYALSFGNFSFLGSAIVPAILGEDALYPYLIFILPLNIAVYTWGVMILIPKGEKKQSVLKSLFNPIFISILLGAILGLCGAKEYIPSAVTTTITNLKNCMGPLAMVLTGFVIGGYKFTSLLKNKRVYIAALLRLFVLPAIFTVILYFAKADRETVILALFAYATPLGLNTVVFPAAYGGDTSTGASMAMISHFACVLTIPIMYAIVSAVI